MKWLNKLRNRKANFKQIDMRIYIKSGQAFFESFEFHLKHNIETFKASFDVDSESEESSWTRVTKNAHLLAEAALVDALCETATRKDVK